MTKPIKITCPIHDSISFEGEQIKILNSKYFQRLRGIKQLGRTSLLYPNAVHSRFTHSIGVFHLAKSMAAKLLNKNHDQDDYLFKVFTYAALLHDVGHGPFSHTFECFYEGKTVKDFKFASEAFEGIEVDNANMSHELMSCVIIKKIFCEERIEEKYPDMWKDICAVICPEIFKKLSKKACSDLDSLCKAISKQLEIDPIPTKEKNRTRLFNILSSIVSGVVDADRLDYLQRDAYFTGVKLCSIDFSHLIDSISIGYHNNEFIFLIKESGVASFEQVLISRKHMFDRVYMHKKVFIYNSFLEKIIKEKKDDIWKGKSLEAFLCLNDESILSSLGISSFKEYRPLEIFNEVICYQEYEEQQKSFLNSTKEENYEVMKVFEKPFTSLNRDSVDASFYYVKHSGTIHSQLVKFSNLFRSTVWRDQKIRLVAVQDHAA